jgi:hypothetical protein
MSSNFNQETLEWKVHTHGLLTEILGNPECASLKIPLNILLDILRSVGKRASEINDPELNKLMIRLSLYSIANPDDPDYNPKLCSKILEDEIRSHRIVWIEGKARCLDPDCSCKLKKTSIEMANK